MAQKGDDSWNRLNVWNANAAFPVLNRSPMDAEKLRDLRLHQVQLQTAAFYMVSKGLGVRGNGLSGFPAVRMGATQDLDV